MGWILFCFMAVLCMFRKCVTREGVDVGCVLRSSGPQWVGSELWCWRWPVVILTAQDHRQVLQDADLLQVFSCIDPVFCGCSDPGCKGEEDDMRKRRGLKQLCQRPPVIPLNINPRNWYQDKKAILAQVLEPWPGELKVISEAALKI